MNITEKLTRYSIFTDGLRETQSGTLVKLKDVQALLAERTTSPVSQMTAHLAAIEEALKVMLDNGLSECYAYDEAVEALTSMKATPANCQDNEGEKA